MYVLSSQDFTFDMEFFITYLKVYTIHQQFYTSHQ